MSTILIYQAFPKEVPVSPMHDLPECIATCSGWRSFREMTLGAVSWLSITAEFNADGLEETAPEKFGYLTWGSLPADFVALTDVVAAAQWIVGFNSKGFDDVLIHRCSPLYWKTDVDLLDEIRLAKFGSTNWSDQPARYSYRLQSFDIARTERCNLFSPSQIITTAQLHPDDLKQPLFDNLQAIKRILFLGCSGQLHDHNDGQKIQFYPFPHPVTQALPRRYRQGFDMML